MEAEEVNPAVEGGNLQSETLSALGCVASVEENL